MIKKCFHLIFFGLFLCLGSCMFLNTKVHYSESSKSDDVAFLHYKARVVAHYDSVSKIKKVMNDAFDDNFLESNIKIIYNSINTLTPSSYIDLGNITGKAHEEDLNWLLYKMKKKAILQGANSIVVFKILRYDNSGSLGRLILGKKDQDSPPVKRVYCSGKAAFVK